MSEIAKTLLPPEKSLKRTCQRARPARANPTSLLDLVIDQNIKNLGGKEFLIYDSVPGSDRILMFGTEENKHILTISSIWMADGTFKTVPSLFAQLYTIHGLAQGSAICGSGAACGSLAPLHWLPVALTKYFIWK